MAKRTLIILFLLFAVSAEATTVETYKRYQPHDTVDFVDLNGNDDNIRNVLNGNLDNDNAAISRGIRFIEILAGLPAPGNQGRVVFDTTQNTLSFDTGSAFASTPTLSRNNIWTGTNTFNGNVDINGGTIDNTTIGTETSSTSVFNNITTGTTVLRGPITILGDTRGAVFTNGSSSLKMLPPGLSGQFLKSNGTGADLTYDWAPIFLSSINTGSGATDTGRIPLLPSRQYYVTVSIDSSDVNAITLDLQFYNSGTLLNGASDYAWVRGATEMDTTPTVAYTGDDADDSILFPAVANDANNGFIKMEMYIDTYQYETVYSAFVKMNGSWRTSAPEIEDFSGSGTVVGNYTINGFGFAEPSGGANNFNYQINVYEIRQTQ